MQKSVNVVNIGDLSFGFDEMHDASAFISAIMKWSKVRLEYNYEKGDMEVSDFLWIELSLKIIPVAEENKPQIEDILF